MWLFKDVIWSTYLKSYTQAAKNHEDGSNDPSVFTYTIIFGIF